MLPVKGADAWSWGQEVREDFSGDHYATYYPTGNANSGSSDVIVAGWNGITTIKWQRTIAEVAASGFLRLEGSNPKANPYSADLTPDGSVFVALFTDYTLIGFSASSGAILWGLELPRVRSAGQYPWAGNTRFRFAPQGHAYVQIPDADGSTALGFLYRLDWPGGYLAAPSVTWTYQWPFANGIIIGMTPAPDGDVLVFGQNTSSPPSGEPILRRLSTSAAVVWESTLDTAGSYVARTNDSAYATIEMVGDYVFVSVRDNDVTPNVGLHRVNASTGTLANEETEFPLVFTAHVGMGKPLFAGREDLPVPGSKGVVVLTEDWNMVWRSYSLETGVLLNERATTHSWSLGSVWVTPGYAAFFKRETAGGSLEIVDESLSAVWAHTVTGSVIDHYVSGIATDASGAVYCAFVTVDDVVTVSKFTSVGQVWSANLAVLGVRATDQMGPTVGVSRDTVWVGAFDKVLALSLVTGSEINQYTWSSTFTGQPVFMTGFGSAGYGLSRSANQYELYQRSFSRVGTSILPSGLGNASNTRYESVWLVRALSGWLVSGGFYWGDALYPAALSVWFIESGSPSMREYWQDVYYGPDNAGSAWVVQSVSEAPGVFVVTYWGGYAEDFPLVRVLDRETGGLVREIGVYDASVDEPYVTAVAI